MAVQKLKPVAIATPSSQDRFDWLRRAAVTVAAMNITPSTTNDVHNRLNAVVRIAATAASCSTARTAARGTVHGEPRLVDQYTAAAASTSTEQTMMRVGLRTGCENCIAVSLPDAAQRHRR